jgi:hypothetical protein
MEQKIANAKKLVTASIAKLEKNRNQIMMETNQMEKKVEKKSRRNAQKSLLEDTEVANQLVELLEFKKNAEKKLVELEIFKANAEMQLVEIKKQLEKSSL